MTQHDWSILAGITLIVAPAIICFLKGKPAFGLLGFFGFQAFALIGMIRLAKPDSWWARHYYEAGSVKDERSRQRYAEDGDGFDS